MYLCYLARSANLPIGLYILPSAAGNIDLADELVLHKNGQARNNICTL